MKKSERNKLSNTPFESLERTLQRQERAAKIAWIKEAGNNRLEGCGRVLRQVLNLPESHNPNTNRRAGLTFIAAGALILGSMTAAAVHYSEPLECRTFDKTEFMYDDLNVLATEIADKIDGDGDSNTFDSVQDSLLEDGTVDICGAEYIQAVDALSAN